MSTRDPGDRSGAIKSDTDSQVPKKTHRRKQFQPSKRKRDERDSGEDDEVHPQSVLNQPSKPEEEGESVQAKVRPHVTFDVQTPPNKGRPHANPPTPHPSVTSKSLGAAEEVERVSIPEELRKPAPKSAPVAASSTSKSSRKTGQKSTPVAAPEPVPVATEEQSQQQASSSAKSSATKRPPKGKPKHVAHSPGERY